jgi:hypothetical protein
MPYTLTDEQKDIISYASTAPEGSVLAVEAVAGASKSYTLLKTAQALPHTWQMYLCFNKDNADEARTNFPHYTECRTTSSLAVNPIVHYGLSLEGMTGTKRVITKDFTYRDIKEDLTYDEKLWVLEEFNKYCTSSYVEESDNKYVQKYFNLMVDKKIPCTFGFCLKMYHILLYKGCITFNIPYDLIMFDEFQDVNECTIEILKLLPANIKIVVGDSEQSVYSFNHCINGFKYLDNISATKSLSQSFRCSLSIANRVESFCQRHLNPDFVFKGTKHSNTTIHTHAILARTNSALIEYMITFMKTGTEFMLTKKSSEVFATVLTLMNMKQGATIYADNMKYLKKDMDYYYKHPAIQAKHGSCLKYVNYLHGSEDKNIEIAFRTIITHGASVIYEVYKYIKALEERKIRYPITLSTAHASKGFTFDEVTLADDFPLKDIIEVPIKDQDPSMSEELRLYYIACTRAKHKLNNAIYLNK